MKKILIFLFFINSFYCFAQNDTISKPNAHIGVDLFSPVLSLFSNQKGAEVFFYLPINTKWHLATEVGYEKNHYDKNNWDVSVNGMYGKLGFNWFLSQDKKDSNMGFYLGVRAAFSPYQQTINSLLIRGYDENITGSIPQHSAFAFWLEPLAGCRVKIFRLPLYIDTSVNLKILLGGKGKEGIKPISVPGFGENVSGLNLGVKWGVSYALPF